MFREQLTWSRLRVGERGALNEGRLMTTNDARRANQQGLLAFVCDHLVSLVGTYVSLNDEGNEKTEECFFALPGFIMIVRGRWYLVTAGHSIQELEEQLARDKYRMTNCGLA